MTREELLFKINDWVDYDKYKEAQEAGKSVKICGIEGSCADFFAASRALESKNTKLLYIAENDYTARRACENLNAFLDGGAVLLERSEYMFYNALAKSEETDYRRMETLRRVATDDYKVLVAPVGAVLQPVLPREFFRKLDFTIEKKKSYDTMELSEKLAKMGYVRTPVVDGKRQFSLRGDILDIFPTSAELPVRVEFFGDEVDTIRVFSPVTQRSVEDIESFSVLAESEFQLGLSENPGAIRQRTEASLTRRLSRVKNAAIGRSYEEQVKNDLEMLEAGVNFPGRDRYIPFVIGSGTVFDWLEKPLVFAENKRRLIDSAGAIGDEQKKMCESVSQSLWVPDELFDYFLSDIALEKKLDSLSVTYLEQFYDDGSLVEESPFERTRTEKLYFKSRLLGGCAGNDVMIKELVGDWTEKALNVYVFAERREKFEKLTELVSMWAPTGNFEFCEGTFSGSFESESLGFAVVSENTFYTKSQRKKTKKHKGNAIENFADIKPGDYVVHDVHGIGIFEGFQSRVSDGVKKDYVVVRYADNGKLWLPTFQLDSLSKYIGSDDYIPKINTLGGRDWNNQKERVKRQLRDYVDELAQLYAKRSSIEGFAFSGDSEWQREFEADFDFEPTDDQVTSTEEIKRDMESPHPMERLLCGDVGFGKTEVALRAAFKAVLDGKQVAILCPTTVLAQQHYKTVKARFEKYPVNVDYVCRFRTAGERTKIFERLKEGKIDILIGTHSLLQKNAVFKDLGLIIVDEEQRFGVMQKEKLKMKWPSADMLYLSATPIPRTLNMSLSKIRDISLLTDPPKMRNPVQTYVIEWDPTIIKNAIYREMARRGQVFYLFNRVQLMGEKLMELQNLVPEARIAMANGQMPERDLENVMQAFIDKEYDVLLCSAIIESGLDIPNANTIIVENGQRLGLAQLYQIRGRVGRSTQRAYAYITFPKNMEINSDAEKRLATIKEFTEFGSGFKVALRDLQIRGAGSVLGERQHGEVSSIGYDMYCKLLSDMILEATGEEVPKEEVVINVEIAVDSYIPDDFVSDRDLRMDLYKKIANVTNDSEIHDLTEELIDRFGDVPKNVLNLMRLSKMRYLAGKVGVKAVTQIGSKVDFTISDTTVFDACIQNNFAELNKNYRGRFNVMMGDGRLYAEFGFSSKDVLHDQGRILGEIEGFLELLAKTTA